MREVNLTKKHTEYGFAAPTYRKSGDTVLWILYQKIDLYWSFLARSWTTYWKVEMSNYGWFGWKLEPKQKIVKVRRHFYIHRGWILQSRAIVLALTWFQQMARHDQIDIKFTLIMNLHTLHFMVETKVLFCFKWKTFFLWRVLFQISIAQAL